MFKRIIASLGVGLAALGALTGCGTKAVPIDSFGSIEGDQSGSSTDSETDTTTTDSDTTDSQEDGTETSTTSSSQNYADGVYTFKGVYGPISEDSIDVELTLKNGIITSVEVVGHAANQLSETYQSRFIAAIDEEVVGQPIEGLSVDKVGGASWTSEAFNTVLEETRTQAAS